MKIKTIYYVDDANPKERYIVAPEVESPDVEVQISFGNYRLSVNGFETEGEQSFSVYIGRDTDTAMSERIADGDMLAQGTEERPYPAVKVYPNNRFSGARRRK